MGYCAILIPQEKDKKKKKNKALLKNQRKAYVWSHRGRTFF